MALPCPIAARRLLLAGAALALFALPASPQGTPGTWEPTTPGSPCADGSVPEFEPLGTLHDNPGVPAWQVLPVAGGPPFAPALLILGLQELAAPFKGGVLGPVPSTILGLQLDADGFQSTGFLLGVQARALPHGLSIWFQWWLVDPGVPSGFCSTRTVRGTIAAM